MNVRRAFTVLALALLALVACRPGIPPGRYPGDSEPPPIPTVLAAAKPTFVVQRGDVTARIALNGRIAPVVEENLAFPLDGQVGQVLVAAGDAVAAGDVLAMLDTAQLEQDRLVAESELNIARARLAARQAEIGRALHRAELRRDMALLDYDFAVAQAGAAPSAAARHEIDRLRLALELAQLDVEELDQAVDPGLQVEIDAAALRLEQIDAALAAARLVAPFDGTVLKVSKTAGRGVVAGETVLVLADVTELRAGAGARDSELAQLSEDLPATVSAASGRGAALTGFVSRLPYPYGSGGDGETVEGDKTVYVTFDDPAAARAAFELGERVEIVAVTATREAALWLPPQAIRVFSGRRFVVVEEGGAQQRVDVVLGIEGDGRIEIVQGLSEGQVVVAP